MSGIGTDLLEDCSMHVDRRRVFKDGRAEIFKMGISFKPDDFHEV